ncbi:MAG TPA: DUF2232 domain-containing protein [Smithellaceae bacterium]|nr:DUF2232 domain-containing protein [Smithellaceae bacterium]HRS83960.1 DUF2232 domain-containing protein [Smithellaceae bacterium]HRV44798.1 DUF2232 domain-containing protein [Smithellaceae bacterium]
MTTLPLSFFHVSFPRLLLIITLFLTASLLPFAGLVFLLVIPLVLYVLWFLADPAKTLLAFLASFCIVAVLLWAMDAAAPLTALAAMGFAGMLMAWSAEKRFPVEAVVLLPTLILLGAIAFYFIYGGMQQSISPWQMVENNIREAVELNIQFYSRIPMNAEEFQSITDSKPRMISLFTRLFPALCVMAALFTMWLNLVAASRLLKSRGVLLPQLSNLSEWSAPAWLVWIFIAAGGLSAVPVNSVRIPGVNVLLVVSSIYFLQGLAMVSFFFQHKNISPFFRFLAYFLIAIQQILMIAIAALGFFNLWVDFRKYLRKDRSAD